MSESTKLLRNNLTEGPVLRQLIIFAIPLMLANVLQTAYGMVDMIIIGHFVGADGLSAVGIASQLHSLFTTLGMSFATGGQILISQQIGTGDIKGINRTVGSIFTLQLIIGLLAGVLGIAFCTQFLEVMNTPAEAMEQAKLYMYIGCTGMVFIYWYNAVSAVLRGMGESRLPLVFIAVATVVNIVLDLLFIGVFGWGAAGAAAATVIGQAVAFFFAIIYLYRHKEQFHFDFRLKSFKLERRRTFALLRLGIPMAAQFVAVTVSMMYVSAMVNAFGLIASAVDGVGNKLSGIMNIVSGALMTAGAAMIGQNFGAGRFDRIKQVVRYSMLISICFWVLAASAITIFPKQIFMFFSDDPQVLAYAPQYMKIAVVFYLGLAVMSPPMAVVEGIGNARLGLIVGILDGVVARIALSALLGVVMGLPGYWLGNALAGFVSFAIEGVYYLTGKWKERSVVLRKQEE